MIRTSLVRTAIVVASVVLAGCVTPSISMDTPEGFAPFDIEDTFQAMSPEGVVVRARTVENDPPQTLVFWVELLERHMTESGYLLVDRGDFVADGNEGMLLEWLAPVREDDWIFLTAIAVIGERIAIVEAAGPTDLYNEYRSAIRRSLATITLNGQE